MVDLPISGTGSPERSPLDAALAYVARGWRVIPLYTVRANGVCSCRYGAGCRTPGKHPRVDTWKELASRSGAVVNVWWGDWPDANVGIVTGAASGLIGLDNDPDKGGEASLAELQRRYGTLPDTITAFTGGGGLHYFYAHPGSPHVLRNPTGLDGLPGLDVRADGGYVVAAPSVHISGRRYCWQHYEDREIAPAPAWLVDLLEQPEPIEPPLLPSANSHLNGHRRDDDGRKWLDQALAEAQDGTSDRGGYLLAQQLFANHVSDFYAILQQYAARASFRLGDPFTERDIERWIRSAGRSDIAQRGEPARSRTAQVVTANVVQTPRRLPAAQPTAQLDDQRVTAGEDVADDETTDRLTTLLADIEAAQSDSPIWDQLDLLAHLDRAAWARVKTQLKALLGKTLNLNDLERAVTATRQAIHLRAQRQRLADDGLPVIDVTDRPLRDLTADGIAALVGANDPPLLYVRSGSLARVRRREDDRPIIDALTEPILRGRLARVASFVRASEAGTMHISPPEDVVRDVLALGEWPLPPLVGITEAPVLRPDGSLVDQPGYDASTRLIYAPPAGFSLPPVPHRPTPEQVQDALALVEEAVCDFPFVDAASRANALGLLLSPIIRPALGESNTPLALVDAPKAGTGKGLLAQVVAIIATGRASAIITAPSDEDEWRKRITAVLSMGATIINIDNLEGRFASANVAAAITASTWQDRILGKTETITLSQRATWLATGNNIRLGGDIPRRCYWIRLDAKMARPYERERERFAHPDLLPWVLDRRAELLASLLTIARSWFADGRPAAQNTPAIGSFEHWCHTVAGVLAHAGVGGFLSNLASMHDQVDDDTPEWEHFFLTWFAEYGTRVFTVADLLHEWEKAGASSTMRDALPGYLAAAHGKGSGHFVRAFGKALSSQVDVRYGSSGLHLVRAGEFRRAVQWRVVDDRSEVPEQSVLV